MRLMPPVAVVPAMGGDGSDRGTAASRASAEHRAGPSVGVPERFVEADHGDPKSAIGPVPVHEFVLVAVCVGLPLARRKRDVSDRVLVALGLASNRWCLHQPPGPPSPGLHRQPFIETRDGSNTTACGVT